MFLSFLLYFILLCLLLLLKREKTKEKEKEKRKRKEKKKEKEKKKKEKEGKGKVRKYKKKICLFCLVAFCSTRLQEQFPNEVKGRANDQNSKKTDPSSPILSRETQAHFCYQT